MVSLSLDEYQDHIHIFKEVMDFLGYSWQENVGKSRDAIASKNLGLID